MLLKELFKKHPIPWKLSEQYKKTTNGFHFEYDAILDANGNEVVSFEKNSYGSMVWAFYSALSKEQLAEFGIRLYCIVGMSRYEGELVLSKNDNEFTIAQHTDYSNVLTFLSEQEAQEYIDKNLSLPHQGLLSGYMIRPAFKSTFCCVNAPQLRFVGTEYKCEFLQTVLDETYLMMLVRLRD